MSPNHRADPPGTLAPVSADAPDELDVLVDRLADEQASTAASEARGPSDGAGRPEPPSVADEMATLEGFLDFLRATIRWKVEGLSDEQASARMLGSATTVTGMVRHLADTERYWFRQILGAVPVDEVGYAWEDGSGPSHAWELDGGASLAGALEDYEAATRLSRAQLLGRDVEEELRGRPEVVTVRWVLTHMVEETARHAGQLDVLAELLDGRTGE